MIIIIVTGLVEANFDEQGQESLADLRGVGFGGVVVEGRVDHPGVVELSGGSDHNGAGDLCVAASHEAVALLAVPDLEELSARSHGRPERDYHRQLRRLPRRRHRRKLRVGHPRQGRQHRRR